MRALSITVLSLLSFGLAASLAELGLVAYGIWWFDQPQEVIYDCGFGEICDEIVKVKVPDIVSFLLFCAIWSTLISGGAIGLPLFLHQRNGQQHNAWLAPGLIVIYFLTWVFWLAGFADLANDIGSYGTAIMDAVLAMAVFGWLTFMALFIFSFLAIFDVMEGEWPGYLVMKSRSSTAAPPPPPTTTTPAYTGAAAEPKYETGHELTA